MAHWFKTQATNSRKIVNANSNKTNAYKMYTNTYSRRGWLTNQWENTPSFPGLHSITMNVQYTIFVRQVWFVAIFYDQRVNITLKHKMFNKLRLLHLCSLGIITTKINWTDDFRSEINFSHFLFVHSELDIEFIIISLCVLTEIHNIMANQITCQQWKLKKSVTFRA